MGSYDDDKCDQAPEHAGIYIYQPAAGFRRLLDRKAKSGRTTIPLRWGIEIEVDLGESIGRALSHHGLFEISVVESIFRLIDPNDIFLDAGANLGFMSSVAVSAGAREINSFEPHPILFERLSRNVSLWERARPEIAGRIHCQQVAISDKPGHSTLNVPMGFETNMGTSFLEEAKSEALSQSIVVRTTTLDEIIGERSIGILKIDIEGHEMKAFAGCQNALNTRRIRDIIFEDHGGMTSPVAQLLSKAGFTLFGINKTLMGPVLLDSQIKCEQFRSISNEPLNFLATLEPDRARGRMMQRGYRCLAKTGRS